MKKETNKREEDIIVGYSNENIKGNPFYRPVILHQALLWAIISGILFGLLAYLIARGTIPIADLGQFSASYDWVSALTGAGFGLALGGLIGGLLGTKKMLQKN